MLTLADAMMEPDFAVMTELIREGADPNEPDETGYFLLHYAADLGYDNVVEFLLANGADPNGIAADGATALGIAVDTGFEGIIRSLARHGADLNFRFFSGASYLDLAYENRQYISAVTLMDLGLNVEDADTVHTAEEAYPWLLYEAPALYAVETGNYEQLQIALQHGLDPDTNNEQPLIVTAARRGDLPQVELLLSLGANPNKLEHIARENSIIAASVFGHRDVVRTLIRAGADVNHARSDGMTALIVASEKGFLEIVEDLIAHGANVDARNRRGFSALDAALKHQRYDIAIRLLDRGAVYRSEWRGY